MNKSSRKISPSPASTMYPWPLTSPHRLPQCHLLARALGQTAAELSMHLVAGAEVARRTFLLDTHLVARQSA